MIKENLIQEIGRPAILWTNYKNKFIFFPKLIAYLNYFRWETVKGKGLLERERDLNVICLSSWSDQPVGYGTCVARGGDRDGPHPHGKKKYF